MKCRVCKAPAVIDVRRHNANFCVEHFLRLCRDQVRRPSTSSRCSGPGERVLVAVSGGKDSLALWDLLLDLGYETHGLYVGLGIGEYSDSSATYARAFAEERDLELIEVDLRETHGYDIPTGAQSARRAPCSVCGISKRHVFDQAALDGGYDALATGHNLDDEAAVLFGNVLRWDTEYLARQQPVLPEREGFPRKVKPLVRLGERETAAYCILRGIDYEVEECPMAVGNKHLGYKEALNAIEATSPGSKQQFYFGFLERAAAHFAAEGEDGRRRGPVAVRALRRPDARRGVRLLPARRAGLPDPARRGTGAQGRLVTPGRPLQAGEQVLLIDGKDRRYLVRLDAGGEFHTHAGILPHDQIIGGDEGRLLRANTRRHVPGDPADADRLRPQDEARRSGHLPQGPRAAAASGRRLPRRPGPGVGRRLRRPVHDPAAGRGRRSWATRCARTSRPGPRPTCADFLGDEAFGRYRVEIRDCYEGIDETDLDRVILDLPEPWQVVAHAAKALVPGGIFVAYCPSIIQVSQLRQDLDHAGFFSAETVEILQRTWHVEGLAVRPDHRMVAHTGFLTHARAPG